MAPTIPDSFSLTDSQAKQLTRRRNVDNALSATDIRDVNDIKAGRSKTSSLDWADSFVQNFRDYILGAKAQARRKKKNMEGTEAKLWSAEEIGNQLLDFLRERIPMEPSTSEEQTRAMNRIDSRRYTQGSAGSRYKEGVENIPTPALSGSIQAYLRSMRQHSQGMGGKI